MLQMVLDKKRAIDDHMTIDGTAASGKGTLGRTLAMRLGLDHLDTGLLYRTVGLAAKQANLDIENASDDAIQALVEYLDLSQEFGPELRSGSEVGELASKVAALPLVRSCLLEKQREFAQQPPHGKGAVLDGRDIGSVVLPRCRCKILCGCSCRYSSDTPPFGIKGPRGKY